VAHAGSHEAVMSAAPGRPKVSVCVITYNQEAVIGECLQSIVEQQTDFPFEVIVGEDCSSDGTRAVVETFAADHPGLVRPIYQPRNIGGGSHNFRTVHLAAQGHYVAHVDGDDLMLPGKLQAQADLLDARPDIAFCAHAVRVIGSDHLIGADPAYPEVGDIRDLLRLGTYFAHSSVMYRREGGGVEPLPEQAIDYYMHIERAARGGIFLDKRVLGAYRYHASGISASAVRSAEVERLYELAFDRALALGVDPDFVERCRLLRRMKHAVGRCLAGDADGYARLVALQGQEWRRAGWPHRVLSLTRRVPGVVHLYFGAKRLLARRSMLERSA
jgi:glycosyltransferase involved in cell wall biosynthesis